jgi:tripartite-type tricarboxylate transporter receptor subunit TctC
MRDTMKSKTAGRRPGRWLSPALLALGLASGALLHAPQSPAQSPAQSAATPPAPAPKVPGYPGRPLRLIINVAAGGSADIAARTIVPSLEKELGINIVIVNRPGAGQQVGLQELATSKPDGYTIGLITLPAVATIYLDPRRQAAFGFNSFQPLAQHVVDPIGIAVRGDSQQRSVKELIAAARATPGKLRAGSTGVLSANHLGLLQFEKQAGVRFATVQFDGGGAENLAAILGGNVDVAFSIVGSWVQHARSGKLRFLALMDRERSKFLPDLQTLDELGYRGIYSTSTRAFAAPRGLRPEIAKVLEAALARAILNPEVLAKMEASHLLTRYTTGAEFSRHWRNEENQIRELMKLVGQ